MKKLLLMMFLGLFMLSLVMAFEFDNVGDYDTQTKSLRIDNSFGLGRNLAELTLNTPINYRVAPGYQKVAEITIDNKGDYSEALRTMRFYDKHDSMKEFSRDFDYKVRTLVNTVVDDYEDVCTLSKNGTRFCDYEVVGSHSELRSEWIKLNTLDLTEGVHTIGIFTDVKIGDKIEWIPTFYGVEISEWATWTQDLNVNLTSYYKLDGTVGPVIDSTESVNATNDGATRGIPAIINDGFSFDGVDDELDLNYNESFNDVFTFAGWVRLSELNAENGLFGRITGGSGLTKLSISSVNNSIEFRSQVPLKSVHSNTSLAIDTWYHVAFVKDGTTGTFYLNGSNVGNVFPGNEGVTIVNFTLGGIDVGNFLNGSLDEVAIWNRTLNASEIQQLYNNGLGITFNGTSITLNSPADNSVLVNQIVQFNCSATGSISSDIENMSLYTNESGSFAVRNTTLGIAANATTQTWQRTYNDNDSILWSCQVCLDDDSCNFANNRTFSIGKFVENSQTFNSLTTEGNTENFIANISIRSGLSVTAAVLVYNGVNNVGDVTVSGDDVILSKDIIIPGVASETNFTFFWSVLLSDSTQFNLTFNNQTVNNLGFDNCSVFSNVLFNLTVVDEATQVKLNGAADNVSVEIDLSLFSLDKSIEIINFSTEYNGTNSNSVCSEVNLFNGTTFILDTTIRYSAADRAIEFYNIRDSTIDNTSSIQNITLFDIKTSESTDFQITFKNSNFIVVDNALIQVNRQYVSEGVFKTVELPITDSNGQAVVHLVQNDIVYNYIVTKNNVVIGTFNNLVAFCDDASIGQCFISLNAIEGTEEVFNPDAASGVSFTPLVFNATSRDLSITFSTNDGSVKTVTMSAIKMDQIGNTSVCSTTVVSSSGTIICNVPVSFGNETIIVTVSVNGATSFISYFSGANPLDIGLDGFFILLFLVVSTSLMFTESKSMTIIGVIVGLIGGGLLFLTKGGFLATGASMIWIIIMGIILIWKLNSEAQT